MAITWVKTTVGPYDDMIVTGSGSLSAAGEDTSFPDVSPAKPFGSVQVLVTAGAITGQIESSNDGTNFSAGYDASGAVRPAMFSGLSVSRNFDDPGFPAYLHNRLILTAGAAGFTGTIIVFLTSREGN